FVCSQAVQYDWMERQYPPLFERIRERVATGQWQPVGAMWVEADMNLPSGESLVRQLVYGQRYFESRFGRRCNEVWIPDVFGYPASLPQIFAAGGCDRFITQKLSWNKQNRFPHSTFQWQGLDGSQVLTHFPPVDTYNATVVGEELVFSEKNFKEHGWSDWSLMPFGHGNGGGGPTREMIERARRFADLDGAPKVASGTTDEFFAHVEGEIAA
ncbi:MAG TPA: alpha-mannosidase, partial [Acidimicrobiaceae bacterium]|nr:alpha-mannosidase [Acidimicrobiaceae bacterium]